MQTFLPVPDFSQSAEMLDYQRLGKQRVEALQVINALTVPGKGWGDHPITRAWSGYVEALALYGWDITTEWIARGYVDNVCLEFFRERLPRDSNGIIQRASIVLPSWLGREDFHSSHRAALLYKNYSFYSQYGWTEEPKQDYIWPR